MRSEVAVDMRGISMTLDGSFGTLHLRTKLLGRFNAENCAGRARLPAVARRARSSEAAAALALCTAPPGRMEVIEPAMRGKPLAVIDYAHTPDALAKALASLARTLPRRALVRVRLRRRSRSRQAPHDGRRRR